MEPLTTVSHHNSFYFHFIVTCNPGVPVFNCKTVPRICLGRKEGSALAMASVESLKRMPFAPSSREALIIRCKKIMDEGPSGDLPGSGPWRHPVIDSRKSLPVSRGRQEAPVTNTWHKCQALSADCVGFFSIGRTSHSEVWSFFDDDLNRKGTMDQDSWEHWHERHAYEYRTLSSGKILRP